MKLYRVSAKYGRSPYQLAAYVEANSPKEAIKRYCGSDEQYRANIDEGFRYRAVLAELPEHFWKMADYIRPDYISAESRKKETKT